MKLCVQPRRMVRVGLMLMNKGSQHFVLGGRQLGSGCLFHQDREVEWRFNQLPKARCAPGVLEQRDTVGAAQSVSDF